MGVLGFDVQWEVGGVQQDAVLERLSAAVERAGTELVHFGPHVWPHVTPIFEDYEKGQFDAEGAGPIAGRWVPLSEAYEAWKSGAHPGKGILEASGALRSGLTESGPFSMRVAGEEYFNFGTQGVEYASFHQTGTRNMPARPPFDFPPEMERELQQAAMAGVRDSLNSSGALDFFTEAEGEWP